MAKNIKSNDLSFFAVRNKEGKWFRRKGYGGYGETWVELKGARLYTRIGGARTQVTYFSNAYPEFGVPEIVEFTVSATKIHNEEERVKKQAEKKLLQQKKNLAFHAKMDYDRAVLNLKTSEAEVERLKKLVTKE